MLRLICDATGQVIELCHDSVSIGRKKELCDVSIDDQSVSGLHCRIVLVQGVGAADDNVTVRIRDLESRHGTWVNDERVVMADLQENDTLRIGGVTFRFTSADRPKRVPERPRPKLIRRRRDDDSVTVEVEILGMIIGPMDAAVVALSVTNGEFNRTDNARIVGQPDWMPISTLLRVLNLDAEEAEPPMAFSGLSARDAAELGNLIESPVSILEADVSEMSASHNEADSETDSDADSSPPEIAEAPPAVAKVDPIAVAPRPVKPTAVVAQPERRWGPPSGFSIPFGVSPKHIGAVLAALLLLYMISWGFRSESSPRLPLYGEIQGAGECNGSIEFRPGSEVKEPAISAEIFKGRYFFTKLNGPLPGAYEVVIHISNLPPKSRQVSTAAGQRPATAAAPVSSSPMPQAAQMTSPMTVTAEGALHLNFQFVPNS